MIADDEVGIYVKKFLRSNRLESEENLTEVARFVEKYYGTVIQTRKETQRPFKPLNIDTYYRNSSPYFPDPNLDWSEFLVQSRENPGSQTRAVVAKNYNSGAKQQAPAKKPEQPAARSVSALAYELNEVEESWKQIRIEERRRENERSELVFKYPPPFNKRSGSMEE